MKKSYILSASVMIMSLAAGAAYAQSTGTEAFEKSKDVVIVKGTRNVGVLKREDGSKSKFTVDQKLISSSTAGQTIAQTLNLVPGYNFTNNDPYGSSGGNVRIRGMDGSRVSLTLDGMQLNDTGNYAIYTNQQLDPNLICQASVNTGATDVDSMTASATGGTINVSTCKPNDKMSGEVSVAGGDFAMRSAFIRLDSGLIEPIGVKSYFAYTDQKSDTWTKEQYGSGKLKKQQYNMRVQKDYDNGSFWSLSGHYNENRNTTIFSQTKATFLSKGYGYNSAYVANLNPSDTGNVRGKIKWVVNDKLTLTFDPEYQYTMATGGGTTATLDETTGKIGSTLLTSLVGFDANKNGTLDKTVPLYYPNITNTNRYSLVSSAIYHFNDQNLLRLNVSIDRGRHRQTGETSILSGSVNPSSSDYGLYYGSPVDVFGAKEETAGGLFDKNGNIIQKRNRFSKANVDNISLEYRGQFLEEKLLLSIGVRSQKMERDLNQFCYSAANGSGNVLCTSETPVDTGLVSNVKLVTFASDTAATKTKYFVPFSQTVDFSKVLPNLGMVYKLSNSGQVFASYSESMSAPRTDSYYSVYYNASSKVLEPAAPDVETSKNFEIGYRFNVSNISLTASSFYAQDKNRIVSAYEPEADAYIDRNVGDVKRYGFEGSFAYKPIQNLTLIAGYSYTKAELQDDQLVKGVLASDGKTASTFYINTKGKQLSETPEHMANIAVSYDFAEQLHFFVNGKYTSDRFATDMNDEVADAYTVWNASMRYDLISGDRPTYLQFNVNNMFDTKYLGSISSKTNALRIYSSDGTAYVNGSSPNYNAGATRTFVIELHSKF